MGTKMLTADHKRQRVEAAQEFLAFHGTTEEEFLTLLLLVTRPGYTTPHRNKGAIEAVETPFVAKSKEVQTNLSAGKIMASIFWDRKGVLLCEFMPRGTTINADRYCETLNKLRRAIQNKRRGMLTKGVRFHHDNARPHTANRTTALVERFGWEMVSHPPYSPDLAPSDFHLFPELKKTLAEPNSRQMKRCKTRLLIFTRTGGRVLSLWFEKVGA
ncbi:mariner Mos1 transposase [Trichonephila clavipes]|nr:mariner Mos1 transposase [Trichonephila clavipes]